MYEFALVWLTVGLYNFILFGFLWKCSLTFWIISYFKFNGELGEFWPIYGHVFCDSTLSAMQYMNCSVLYVTGSIFWPNTSLVLPFVVLSFNFSKSACHFLLWRQKCLDNIIQMICLTENQILR